jgi:hypothetical protein
MNSSMKTPDAKANRHTASPDLIHLSGEVIAISEIRFMKNNIPSEQIVIRLPGQYANKLAFTCWNADTEMLDIGDKVRVGLASDVKETNDGRFLQFFNLKYYIIE